MAIIIGGETYIQFNGFSRNESGKSYIKIAVSKGNDIFQIAKKPIRDDR